MNDLDRLLHSMVERNASDLHLNHNCKITYRVDGKIFQDGQFIKGRQIFEVVAVNALEHQQQTYFHENKSIDFSYELDKTRFRGSLVSVSGQPGCVFRKINSEIIPIDELGLPPIIKELSESDWGLILIGGPTGSGKTTTLASMVDHINNSKPVHITTAEHPIEYVHKNKKAIVTQREVGKDTPSFAQSMKDVLRLDPDVILVGEMRDLETVSAAVTNAETGHLVMGTIHTNTAPHAINRIVDIYPIDQHHNVRSQLASNMKAVINQRLFPKPGGGRTPIFEIMVLNDNMREAIRKGKPEKLKQIMKENPQDGNLLFEDSIKQAKEKGLLSDNIRY